MISQPQVALALSGTGITTSYQQPASGISAGLVRKITVLGQAVTITGTNATAADLKLRGSLDDINWFDLATLDLTTAAATTAIDQSKTISGAATTSWCFVLDQPVPYVTVAGKFVGGTGKAGELLGATLQMG